MNLPNLILSAVAIGVVAAPVIQQAVAEPTRDSAVIRLVIETADPAGLTDVSAEAVAKAARNACEDAVVRSPLLPRAVHTCTAGATAEALRQIGAREVEVASRD